MNGLIENMKKQFIELSQKYSKDKLYVNELWNHIQSQYTSEKRHYHSLEHLYYMLTIIAEHENKLQDKEAIILAVWFHDIIYDTNRKDNEEQSAEFAENALRKINTSNEFIKKVTDMILLTKNHSLNFESDFDTKLFLDADLAILGGSRDEYNKYLEGIRKEYRQYPDMLYNGGRKIILEHFLQEEYIYKTEELRNRLEKQARENITFELKQLSI